MLKSGKKSCKRCTGEKSVCVGGYLRKVEVSASEYKKLISKYI